MNREEQFESVDGLCTWYDKIMIIYEAAFAVHYRILNNSIDAWIAAIKDDRNDKALLKFMNKLNQIFPVQ